MADHHHSGRESEQIRREIERTRAEMDHTVDELSERLSPGHIVDEIWGRVREGDGLSHLGTAFKNHPVPMALVGVGLGMLAMEATNGRSNGHARHVGPGTYGPAEGRRGPYGADAVDHGDADWAHAGTGTRAKAKLSDAAHKGEHAIDSARERASGMAESAREKATGMAGTAREKAGAAADRVRHVKDEASAKAHHLEEKGREAMSHAAAETRQQAERARRGFSHTLEENPLALGALAFGLGLAGALLVPSSPIEDRTMGRAADAVKEEARRTAESAKRVARETAESAS